MGWAAPQGRTCTSVFASPTKPTRLLEAMVRVRLPWFGKRTPCGSMSAPDFDRTPETGARYVFRPTFTFILGWEGKDIGDTSVEDLHRGILFSLEDKIRFAEACMTATGT